MVAGLGVDIWPIMGETLARGGHVRVGLEDAPLGTERSNADLVREAVERLLAAGHEPAVAAEVRADLKTDRPGA